MRKQARERRRNPARTAKWWWHKLHDHYTSLVALAVRAVLLVHAIVALWVAVSLRGESALWALLACNVPLVVESVYTIFWRSGRESKWFCPCFLAFLAAELPSIWLVELHRLHSFADAYESGNVTGLVELPGITGLTVPFKLEPNVWVSMMEQTLLFLLVLCRWLLPRGQLSRNELSQLLFVFMGIASDNMELFQLFDETAVRKDEALTYVILAVWSLSLLQFTFVLTSTRNPRKIRAVQSDASPPSAADGRRKWGRKRPNCAELFFTTEIWSLLFSVLVQDGPYVAVRIFTIVRFNLLTYSVIFFVCKNVLIICLVLYRLIVVCASWVQADASKVHDRHSSIYAGKERSQNSDSMLMQEKEVPVMPLGKPTFDPSGGENEDDTSVNMSHDGNEKTEYLTQLQQENEVSVVLLDRCTSRSSSRVCDEVEEEQIDLSGHKEAAEEGPDLSV